MVKCPHCADCFNFQLIDCTLTGTKAVTVNRMRYDYEMTKKEHPWTGKECVNLVMTKESRFLWKI